MKKLAVTLAFCSSISLFAAKAPEGEIIIDAFKVMGETEAGKDFQKQIEVKQKRYTDEIGKDQQRLAEMRSELQTKVATLTPKAIEEKRIEMQRREEDLANKARGFENDLQMEMQQASQMLMAEVRTVAEELGKEKNVRKVQDKSGAILYVANELDCTADVVKKMNAQHIAQNKNSNSTTVAKADAPASKATA